MFNRKKNHLAIVSHLFLGNVKRVSLLTFLWASIFLVIFVLGQATSARAAASVALSATPTSRTVNAGQATTYTINIARDNYTGNVTLSASNLPANATASFNPNPTTGKSSTLTVTTKTTTPAGTYQIKVGGSATGLTIAPINVTLIVKPAPSVTIAILPTTQSIIAGQSVTYQIRLTRTNYEGPVTLSTENLPVGVTASFEPNPVNGNSATMRIYSHLLPFTGRDYDFEIIVPESAFPIPKAKAKLRVNCNIDWAEQFGTSQPDFARDVAVDSNGNVYVLGESVNSANNFDVWLAKYNSTGVQQWFVQPFGTNADDRPTEIAVDSAGNIFIGGYTFGTFPNNISRGGFDYWIAKYDNSGNQQWVFQSGTGREDGAFGFEIVPDGSGGASFTTFTDDRRYVSTITVTSNGNFNGETSFGVPRSFRDQPFDLALGPNGSVYIVGRIMATQTDEDAWIAKFDSQGNGVWSDQFTRSDNDIATRIVVDSSGNAFFSGTVAPMGGGQKDAWIAKYDSNGNQLWYVTEASPADDFINALTLNNSGDIIIAGMTLGVLGERNGGGEDAWAARRSGSNGSLVWVRQFPVVGNDGFNAVAVDSNNALLIAGYTDSFKNINLGSQDALLMRYVDSPFIFRPVITSLSQSSGRVNDVIRINGSFIGITGVRFNGVPASFTVVSFNAIDAVVPQGATSGAITVSNGCECASSQTQFTVLP
jgi:hypothetical protein